MSNRGTHPQSSGPSGRRVLSLAKDLRSPNSGLIGQIVRFLLAGGIVAVVYACVTLTLADIVGLHFQISLAIGFAVALVVQFNLYRVFVWAHHEEFVLPVGHQAGRYLLAAAIGYGTTAICTSFLPSVLGISTEIVYLAMVVALPIVNFTVFRYVIFHTKSSR